MTFSTAKPMLSAKDVAKIFGVGTLTVRRWFYDGSLKGYKVNGRTVRFRQEDIEAFVKAHEGKRDNAANARL